MKFIQALYLFALVFVASITSLSAKNDRKISDTQDSKLSNSTNPAPLSAKFDRQLFEIVDSVTLQMLTNTPNPDEWMERFRKLYETGNVKAGWYYMNAIVRDDSDKAEKIAEQIFPKLLQLAQSGDTSACLMVCTLYCGMGGVKSDLTQADFWQKKYLELRKKEIQKEFPDPIVIIEEVASDVMKEKVPDQKELDYLKKYNSKLEAYISSKSAKNAQKISDTHDSKLSNSTNPAPLSAKIDREFFEIIDSMTLQMLTNTPNPDELMKRFRKLYETGNVKAGWYYMNAIDRDDSGKAEKIAEQIFPKLLQLAQSDDTSACMMVGTFYSYGMGGVKRDSTQADFWQKKYLELRKKEFQKEIPDPVVIIERVVSDVMKNKIPDQKELDYLKKYNSKSEAYISSKLKLKK